MGQPLFRVLLLLTEEGPRVSYRRKGFLSLLSEVTVIEPFADGVKLERRMR